MSNNPTVKKILILAANPKNTVRLRLDQEVRDIEEGLQLAAQRDKFSLQQKWAVRSRDISRAVLDFRPNIIHFSGHGSQTEGLSFEDEVGKEKFVTPEALGGLFKLFANHVECVLLNACYSEVQANAIAQHIDYVIGMNQAIADKAALEFAVGFYDALARYDPQYDGDSTIEFAFNVACSSISLAGVSGASIPVLIKNPNPRKRNERRDNQLLGQLIGNIPNLPTHFLPRDEQLNPLKVKVLADTNQPVAITAKSRSVGVQGMGGIGKTVLATALARDEEVRRAFPDGVIWITFGQTPQILTLQSDVVEALGDKQATFTEINSGKTQLRKLLTGKSCLLILDDVWNLEHASAFDVLEKRCQMLITTRDAGIITALGGEEYQLSILNEEQALVLLANWANQAVETLPTIALEVARECGYLPLALSMVGAMMRGKPINRWQNVLEKLRCADLDKIRQQFPDYPYPDLLKAIQVSVEALEPEERERYLDFAVFPEDTPIPEAVLQTFWQPLGLDEFDTQDVIDKLVSKSLASRDEKGNLSLHDLQLDYVRKEIPPTPLRKGGYDPENPPTSQDMRGYDPEIPPTPLKKGGYETEIPPTPLKKGGYETEIPPTPLKKGGYETEIPPTPLKKGGYETEIPPTPLKKGGYETEIPPTSQDMRGYEKEGYISNTPFLRGSPQAGGSSALSSLHNRLLNAYTEKYPNGWHSLENDGYIFLSLAHHLIQAGRTTELQQLLFDFRWLQAKLENSNINELIADYDLLPEDANLQLLRRTLVLSANILAKEKRQLTEQLWGRLQCFAASEIQQLLQQAKQNKNTWLLPLTASLTRPDGNLIRTLSGHRDWVHAIAFSPDGKYVISGLHNSTLIVWNWQTGVQVLTIKGHTSDVNAITFSVDGKYLVSGSRDNTLKVWDWQTGVEMRTIQGHTSWVNAIAFSVDGKYLVSGSNDTTLKVWDWQTGVEVRTIQGHTSWVNAIAFSVDGKYLVSGSFERTLKVWDWQTGVEMRTIQGHSHRVNAIAFSPDGKYLVSGSGDETLKVWDWQTGVEVRTISGHTSRVYAIAFSPDGKYVISASHDRTLKVWDWQTGIEERSISGHTSSVDTIAFSPDGKYVISASHDETLKVWDWQTGIEERSISGHISRVNAITFSPDGKYVISASDYETLKVWDWQTGIEERSISGDIFMVKAIAFSVDGKYLVSASHDETLKLWDWQTGIEERTLYSHRYMKSSLRDKYNAIAFSVDGKYLVSASDDSTLIVWDWQTGVEKRTIQGHSLSVNAIAFSVDGKYLVSASYDSTLKVWDWQTRVEVRTIQGHSLSVNAIAFSVDGKYLVSGSSDSTLKVWNWQTGVEVRTIQGHSHRVNAIAFSVDGKYLISGSSDSTLKVWDWQTGEVIATFTGESAIYSCAVAPDGVSIVAGEQSGRVHFFRLEGV